MQKSAGHPANQVESALFGWVYLERCEGKFSRGNSYSGELALRFCDHGRRRGDDRHQVEWPLPRLSHRRAESRARASLPRGIGSVSANSVVPLLLEVSLTEFARARIEDLAGQ